MKSYVRAIGTRAALLLPLLASACGGDPAAPPAPPGLTCSAPPTRPLPASASGFTPAKGPGGPKRTFMPEELGVACAYLRGGPKDKDHHNTVTMIDGYLVMPWAPEWGGGGFAVYGVDDPCAPETIAQTYSEYMRETHATGFSFMGGGRHAVVNHIYGAQFWDLTDMTKPAVEGEVKLEGVFWPDAYARVVLAVFWQAPYVYVAAADNGVFVIDATDPKAPVALTQYTFDPPLRAGAIHAVGNLLVVISPEGSRTALLDISDPARPEPIPGGVFEIHDGDGVRQEAYFGHTNGDKTWYARKSDGGGLIIYDISNPEAPSYLGDYFSPMGNGGYVFLKEGTAFIGESHFADAVDVTDPTNPKLLTTMNLTGDLDTIVPIGNVAVLSVDEDAVDGQSTAIIPYSVDPDARGPEVTMVNPKDGAAAQALTTRIGLTFNEFVDVGSLWEGSFIVRKVGTTDPLDGYYSGQEGIVNFWPAAPLEPETTYEVVIPAGGVVDFNGNATVNEFRSTFITGPCVLPPAPTPLEPAE